MYLPKGVLHLPGIAMHVWGRQGSWPSGALACGHAWRQGGCRTSCSPWGRHCCCSLISGTQCHGCLMELTCHHWKSQRCTWRWLCHTRFATPWAKTFPVPASVSLSPLIATVFPRFFSFAQGFLFLSTPNQFLSPLKILYFFFFWKFPPYII